MNDLFKLVKKDISLIFKVNKMNFLVLIYPLCMGCLVFNSDLSISIQVVASSVAYAVYGIVVGLITTDEKTKSLMIFQSLPINKKSIIIGKYLFCLIIILIVSLVGSVFPIIKSILDKNISITILSLANSFMFNITLFSVFFPFYFKMGYLKMHAINLIIFYCLIFIPLVMNLFRNIQILKPIIDFVIVILNLVAHNLLIIFVGCIVIYIFSLMISIVIEGSN